MTRGRPIALVAILAVSPCLLPTDVAANEAGGSFFNLGGSADWEYFQSHGVSQGTEADYHALRQRYALDLAGAMWDQRFNRYSLGLDLFRHDGKADGETLDSTTLGYRAQTTFFPNRLFPLKLFARSAATDSTATSLANSDRETAAWGAEWNISTPGQQRILLQYDRTAYDLVGPLVLEERRQTGSFEFTQRFRRRETSFRYGFQNQKELVGGSDFRRRFASLNDRTRFDNGVTLLLTADHSVSDALFSTGDRDSLTLNRVSGVLDVPRRHAVGWNVSYDFSDNTGRFLDSSSHHLRALARVRISGHWESTTTGTVGRLETTTSTVDVTQDLTGVSEGVRYTRDWRRLELSAAYVFAFTATMFNNGPDRTVLNHAADLNLRVPFDSGTRLLSNLSYKQDEANLTGLGYTYDETRGDVGLEGRLTGSVQASGSLHARRSTYDTFEFGVQESREVGIDGSLSGSAGGLSFGLTTGKGISDFIPDPTAGSSFTPGTDLVNRADVATLGGHWRFRHRLQARAQARYERRDFTSIGKERILSYHPEIEWSSSAWRLSLGISHYDRNNATTFTQDTLWVRVSRLMF